MSESFGARLKRLREKANQTQPELANAIGTNTTTISRWERDRGKPHMDQVTALAQHFGCTTDYLHSGTGEGTSIDSEAFAEFLATEWGRIAQKNGWLEAIRSMKVPATVELYIDITMALMRHQERQRKNS